MEVDGPPKRPQQTERVLRSLRAWGELSPLLFTGASADGTLRSYVADERAGLLRWQADYKRLFHANATFLDAWGVFATLADNRLKLLDLPLQSNPQLDGARDAGGRGLVARDDTKGAVQFAAHEAAKTLCVLLKSNTLKVFDWTVNRILEPRAQHELQTLLPTLLPVQRLLLLSESHVFIQGKKEWVVLNLDSGRPLSVKEDVMQQVNEALDGGVTAVCDAVALPSLYAARRRQQVLDLLLCGKQRGVILTIDSMEKKSGDEEEEDVYGAFEQDVSRLGDESVGKALDVSTSQLGMKVDRVVTYNMPPRGVYYHHPFLLLDQGSRSRCTTLDHCKWCRRCRLKHLMVSVPPSMWRLRPWRTRLLVRRSSRMTNPRRCIQCPRRSTFSRSKCCQSPSKSRRPWGTVGLKMLSRSASCAPKRVL